MKLRRAAGKGKSDHASSRFVQKTYGATSIQKPEDRFLYDSTRRLNRKMLANQNNPAFRVHEVTPPFSQESIPAFRPRLYHM
jgi:hypothetical protein